MVFNENIKSNIYMPDINKIKKESKFFLKLI